MDYPKISIVTPSFNQGRYIEQTILSVIDQNYPNLEYIIIDGGSTDNTVEIIKKYEKHLSYWVSEPDKGQTDAINKGFAKCTGDIFNWINSDDYYEPGVLLRLGELFISNPSTEVICGNEWYFHDSDPLVKVLHTGSTIRKSIYETIREGIIVQPATFFKIACIKDFFPLDNSLRYLMDRQLWWNYLLQYGQQNIMQTDIVFTNFRLHAASKSVSEANYFETEFDRLKLSLFQQLNAPEILKNQLQTDIIPAKIVWNPINLSDDRTLAAFAAFYAERKYVKGDLHVVSKLMKHVVKWKNGRMSKNEWKHWIAANAAPEFLVAGLKKIKKIFSFS